MKNILLYNSEVGLDSIQLFSLILSLKNHFKTSNFYYLELTIILKVNSKNTI